MMLRTITSTGCSTTSQRIAVVLLRRQQQQLPNKTTTAAFFSSLAATTTTTTTTPSWSSLFSWKAKHRVQSAAAAAAAAPVTNTSPVPPFSHGPVKTPCASFHTTVAARLSSSSSSSSPSPPSSSSTAAATASSTTAATHTSNTTNTLAAFCHHGYHYETSLAGLHGKQLALAQLAGLGKDDDVFDPFALDAALEEQYEQQMRQGGGGGGGGAANLEISHDNDKETTNGGFDTNPEDDDEQDDDDDDDNDAGLSLVLYEKNGSIRRCASQKAALRAGSPAGGLFAVATFPDASQHKVTVDDVVILNLLRPVTKYAVGSIHTITTTTSTTPSSSESSDGTNNGHVLLVSSSHWTWVGRPVVPHAQVVFQVEEITMDHKVVIFHKRRRKNSQRKNGFRRQVTMVRILDIIAPPVPAVMTTNTNTNTAYLATTAMDLEYYIPRVEPLLTA